MCPQQCVLVCQGLKAAKFSKSPPFPNTTVSPSMPCVAEHVTSNSGKRSDAFNSTSENSENLNRWFLLNGKRPWSIRDSPRQNSPRPRVFRWGYVNTENVLSYFYKINFKSTCVSKTSQPCLHTLSYSHLNRDSFLLYKRARSSSVYGILEWLGDFWTIWSSQTLRLACRKGDIV